jgi:hypothetical protein
MKAPVELDLMPRQVWVADEDEVRLEAGLGKGLRQLGDANPKPSRHRVRLIGALEAQEDELEVAWVERA